MLHAPCFDFYLLSSIFFPLSSVPCPLSSVVCLLLFPLPAARCPLSAVFPHAPYGTNFALEFRARYLVGGFTESSYFTTLSAKHSRPESAEL